MPLKFNYKTLKMPNEQMTQLPEASESDGKKAAPTPVSNINWLPSCVV